MRALSVLVATLLLVLATVARAQEPASDARKDEARAHFERGAALVREQAWEPALAEFLLSRELFPTRGNTQNAAVCLRQLHRYDEALAMLEALLTTFPNLPPADRGAAEEEIRALRALVGTLEVRVSEVGAQIQIDDRVRGESPMPPVRVPAGAHAVRVYKQGFAAFTTRVDVAGAQAAVVTAQLEPLREAGRLQVVEQSGKTADVFVDGIRVGKTPWEGALAPGRHAVRLAGDEGVGTQPAEVDVRADAVTPLTLALELLDAELRIEPVPAGASVALDGVAVGNGVWTGRVKSGGHWIEVAAPGFLPQRRSVLLAVEQRASERIVLERDPESPMWGAKARGHFVFEGVVGFATGSLFGGDVSSSCGAGCSTALPLGGAATLHAGYELALGLGFSLDAGYVGVSQHTTTRAIEATPRGRTPITGTADDSLSLRGVTVGASVGVRTRGDTPFVLRLGAGALLGQARDARVASFANGSTSGVESSAARYGYIAPEARVAVRLAERLDVTLGVRALVLVALTQPTWTDRDEVILGRDFISFGEQTIGSPLVVIVTPGIGLRYEL